MTIEDYQKQISEMDKWLDQRDSRIAELEAEVDTWKSNASLASATITELEVENAKLWDALEKISNTAKCVCTLEVGQGVADCETCKIADAALAATAGDGSEEGA